MIVLTVREDDGCKSAYCAGSIVLLVTTPFWTAMTLALLAVHIYLLMNGQTTYDWLRPIPRSEKKKFTLNNVMRNIFFLCQPGTVSLFREQQRRSAGHGISRFASKSTSPTEFSVFASKMFHIEVVESKVLKALVKEEPEKHHSTAAVSENAQCNNDTNRSNDKGATNVSGDAIPEPEPLSLTGQEIALQ